MEAFNTLNKIAEHIENMRFDVDSLMSQDLDTTAIQRYRERFMLFAEDGCPAAITAYMQKANTDTTLNEVTKLHIMLDATHALDGKLV